MSCQFSIYKNLDPFSHQIVELCIRIIRFETCFDIVQFLFRAVHISQTSFVHKFFNTQFPNLDLPLFLFLVDICFITFVGISLLPFFKCINLLGSMQSTIVYFIPSVLYCVNLYPFQLIRSRNSFNFCCFYFSLSMFFQAPCFRSVQHYVFYHRFVYHYFSLFSYFYAPEYLFH